MKQRFSKITGTCAAVLAVLLAWLGGPLVEGARAQSKAGDIRVVLKPSQVVRQKGPQAVRADAVKGMTLFYQDVLETGVGGRLRARLDDGSILALGPQSRLKVIEHNRQTEQSTFQIEYGKVRAQVVKQTKPGAHFEIQSNTAVAGVLGTDEIVDAFSPIATMVFCIDGLVTVRNADPTVPGSVTLTPGQVTLVQQGIAPSPPRTATDAEVNGALDETGGATPQAIVDLGTGFATVGQEMRLSAADSFSGVGTITGYQWRIVRASDNLAVFDQTFNVPSTQVDTTKWQAGTYKGNLIITTSGNKTGSVQFSFVVLPSNVAMSSPQQVIQNLKTAYETLQPSEFMKLFDPVKYVGYAALRDSIETAFRNVAQIRVFVRTASGQVYEQSKMAIYQVDFEIQFSTKSRPDTIFVTREQATLRMESGSGWLISDVPQGKLGSSGIVGIPGVSDPKQTNTSASSPSSPQGVGPTGGGESVRIVPGAGGERVTVPAGGLSQPFSIQNNSAAALTVSFELPPGITLSGTGVQGTTLTIGPGQTANPVFEAAPGQPAGTVVVHTTVISGTSSLPGPNIPVTVFQLSITFPSGGGSAANPVPVLLGQAGQQAAIQVNGPGGAGVPVDLSASGGQVTSTFSPNPAILREGGTPTTVTLIPAANAPPGADQVNVQANVAGGASATAPLFINRIDPFTFTRTSAASDTLPPSGAGQITFNVVFNSPFAGPVQITAPAPANGVSFTPPSLTVSTPGSPVTFTVIAGAAAPSTPFLFSATAGNFNLTQSVSVAVNSPIQFNLSSNPLSLAPGKNAQVAVQVNFVSGVPQAVNVALVAGTVNNALITVTGGGSVPHASGQVSFNVAAAANAPPGNTSFTVTGSAGGVTQEIPVTVTILGDFALTAPASVTLLQPAGGGNATATVSIGVTGSNGFNAPVSLTVSSNHPGVIASVNAPGTASPGQPATITLSAAGTITGSASVTVEGVSGSVARSITISVSLGSFALSTAAQQPFPVFLGGVPSLPITVTPAAGFTGDVALSATATAGVTVEPIPAVTGGNGTRTITLKTTPTAVAGPAVLTVTGTSGAFTAILQINLQLNEPFTFTSSVTTAAQPLALFIGGTAELPVAVTPSAGFASDVTLTATLGAGLTINNPGTIAGGKGTHTLTLGTTADARPGSVAATLTATFGAFSKSLQFQVQLSEAFTLSQDPATFFLGNPSPLVIHIQRSANFQGSVTVQLGTLPSSISNVDSASQVAAAGTNSVTFLVTAAVDPALSGQTATIPVRASSSTAVSAVRAYEPKSANISNAIAAAFSASGTLQAPFSVDSSGLTSLATVQFGKTASGSFGITFLGNFAGTVQIARAAAAGAILNVGVTGLNATNNAIAVSASASSVGIFALQIIAKAGNFFITTAVTLTVTAVPSSITILSGNNQTGVIGQTLANPLVVRVTDVIGNPVPGVQVTFTVASGTAKLGDSAVTQLTFNTDSQGLGHTSVTLGATAGTVTVTATFAGFTGAPVTFTITAAPSGIATTISKVSGDGQSGTLGQVLANPFVVKVTDSGGNPVANVAVTFAVTAGGGTLSGSTTQIVHTNSQGLASTALTLGTAAVANTVTASATGLSGSPLSFNATASGLPLGLTVTPSSQQVNANIPVTLQIRVIPPSSTFTLAVTVRVQDGTQMKFYSGCSLSGILPGPTPSSVNGVLTFSVGPPYSAVTICMAAGQHGVLPTIGADSATITAAATGAITATTTASFQIGVPVISVTKDTTFNVPLGLGQSVEAKISFTASGGFNLPLTVFVTAPGAILTSTGLVSGTLPSAISSADCGPPPISSGKSVSPGGETRCKITNISTSGSTTPVDLQVFATFFDTFGPGSASSPFQVCALNATGSNSGCGVGILRVEEQLSRVGNQPKKMRYGEIEAGSGLPVLTISPAAIQYSPLMPKESDRVRVRARVENRGESDAHNVTVALVINKQVVATATVDVSAGSSAPVEFEWQAVYQPRLSMAISVDPEGQIVEGANLMRIASVRNFSVEPPMPAMLRQGRSLIVVANRECAGFRFANGAQSFCGGSSDFELSPVITADGQLVVQITSLNGGIIDLGPQPITGVLSAPEAGYQSRSMLENGHLYAVENNRKYVLMYAGKIQSDIDPRLARLEAGSSRTPQIAAEDFPTLQADTLGTLLDRAKISVDLQWSYLENGSRRFQYGFAPGATAPRINLYRQPRTPSAPAKQ